MLKNFFENKTRNSTDQMLFLIKSDIIEHLLFYFCFLIDLSNFYSNQTKPKKKKKKSKSQKTQAKSQKIQKNHISPARSRLTLRSRRREIATLGEIAPVRYDFFSGFMACVFWDLEFFFFLVWFEFSGIWIFFFFFGFGLV